VSAEETQAEKNKREFLAQTKLDEAVYDLFKLGWDESEVYDKVEELWVKYRERKEEE